MLFYSYILEYVRASERCWRCSCQEIGDGEDQRGGIWTWWRRPCRRQERGKMFDRSLWRIRCGATPGGKEIVYKKYQNSVVIPWQPPPCVRSRQPEPWQRPAASSAARSHGETPPPSSGRSLASRSPIRVSRGQRSATTPQTTSHQQYHIGSLLLLISYRLFPCSLQPY